MTFKIKATKFSIPLLWKITIKLWQNLVHKLSFNWRSCEITSFNSSEIFSDLFIPLFRQQDSLITFQTLGYAVLALSGKIFCCRSCSKCGFDLFSFEKIIVETFQQSSIMNLLMDCVCERDRETEMQSEKERHKSGKRQRQKIT